MNWFWQLIDIFLHLDAHLNNLIIALGPTLFCAMIFVVVFCETGLVVTPFLPGDSLLFACGALASISGSPLNPYILVVGFIAAALCGDNTNYWIGRIIGPKVFGRENSRLFNKKHLVQTEQFYEKHGRKTVIIARFVPIIRTFAPFVAGIGAMRYLRFLSFSVIGALAWVSSFVLAGFYLGNVPTVKRNFHFVIVAIIIISVMPAVIEYLRTRKENQRANDRVIAVRNAENKVD
jgi:membrane-associated protein